MRRKVYELDNLRKHRKALHKVKQTPESEYEAAITDLKITVLDNELNAEVAKLASFFLETYRKMGSFEAINDEGVRRKSAPYITDNAVTTMFNIRSEAYKLAAWSKGYSLYISE